MEGQIMKELEQASAIVLAPPNLVTAEQRHVAEGIILEFRKTKQPYSICKYILENSETDYVLFQAAAAIKEGVVREWSLLSGDDIESLRSFLLRFITQHISLQSYVREQILQSVAVIIKRGTLDSNGASLDALFQDVTQLISSGNVTMQLVACSILMALLNEYSSSSRTSTVGFTWEFHMKCKRAFEANDLKRVFLFSLQVLHEIEKQASPLPRETTAVLNRFLTITETVLCWDSLGKRHVGLFDLNQNMTLKPMETWRDTLLDENLIQFIFKLHKKARYNSEMAHHSMMCLSQLASLNGSIFPDDKAKTSYLHSYISCFLEFLTSVDIQDFEFLGIASIFQNLTMMFSATCLMDIPKPALKKFIEQLTRLTCAMGREASMEEELMRDDTVHMEAYEKMLETWMVLTVSMKDFSLDFLQPYTVQVFSEYIQCHISPPDGSRVQNTLDSLPDILEVIEIEEDDREKFSDQLCSIGILGRLVPHHSVPLLSRLMEDRVTRLHGQLERIHQQKVTSSGHDCSYDMTLLNVLNEDLHWLVLLSANVLTEEAEGETPLIPADIMNYSTNQSSSIDLTTTLKVLASPGEKADSIPGASQNSDAVIRLISAVFRLCEVEKQAIAADMSDFISPQVGSSVMWFLKRWITSYLLPDENYYAQMSKALLAAFGRDSEGAEWTVSFLLEKLVSNLTAWTSEEKLLTDTLQCLVSLLNNRSRSSFVARCARLWELARHEASNSPPFNSLPAKSKRLLFKALVLAMSGIKDQQRDEYRKCVLESLKNRFSSLLKRENFAKVCHNGEIKSEVIVLLESLCGVAEASRVDNITHLYTFLHPLLEQCVVLLDVYHNYDDVVPLVLELFSEVVNKQLCFLGRRKSQSLYSICLSALQMYSKHNKGKRIVNADEEENRFNDILITLELLINLLSKDFIDFGDPDTEEGVPQGDPEVNAADVVLYGLNTMIPLMSVELLKFPSLCLQYFRLITFLAECNPEKFSSIPDDLFRSLMYSVELGLSSFGTDITKLCLEAMTSLATFVFQSNLVGSQIHNILQHFLKLVFKMLLLETFNMELLGTASAALFALICCHLEQYRSLVNQLLDSHTDPLYKQRLIEAFNNLTPPSLEMTINRHSKIQFMEFFDQFLVNVRGFLCVR
ncbi:hypothetical protein ACJMK2_030022 [Sinanodonta woodiana]|uniref:Exportin-4 n=1 Tax=Sinanodonta woodiana TaxID=1069815 RepID=A0ABD3XBY7_SINWO